MCLGALVDAGAPLEEIEKGLKKLKLKGYALRERKVVRAGITATKVDVVLGAVSKSQKAEVRKWREIQKIINESAIPEGIKKQGFAIFKALFAAEAKVHGKTISTTHLHELGCVDCLVDVFGTLIGLSVLDVGKIYASPVNVGSGRTKTSHGIFPVPAPATAELLKGIPCYASGPSFELTTPTGAAILTTLSSGFGDMPSMVNETIGTGAGSKDVQEQPNLLRIMIGEAYEKIPRGTVTVIETNIDDMNPQVYAYVMERLFERGALDVFMTQVIMKKSRPGTLLTVLCNAEKKNGLIGIILKETSTLGVRFYEAGRVTIKRDIKQVQTIYGRVRVKQSMLGDVLRIMPEYEDCRRIARENKVSLLHVLETAKRASLKK